MSPILMVVAAVVGLLVLLLILGNIGGRGSMIPLVLAVALGLAFLFFVLTRGGGIQARTGGDEGSIPFTEIFEARPNESISELKVVQSRRLDVDGDNQDEWVVLYQYDPVAGGGDHNWSNSPVQAIIYDALPCSPPLIHNWRLAVPDNDYLGEGPQISATLQNVLPTPPLPAGSQSRIHPDNELVIRGTGPNSHTLSLWRYFDRQSNFPCDPINPMEQGFELLGFWRADVIVPPGTLEESAPESEDPLLEWEDQPQESGSAHPTVITYRRTAFERSQLAIRSVYQPAQDGDSFIGPDGRTVGPVEQSVDFIYGQPALPTDSPYPEKAVATLLLTLGAQGGGSDEYHQRFFEGTPISDTATWKGLLKEALGIELDELSHVLIQSISYQPDREAELRHEQRTVRTTLISVTTEGRRRGPFTIDWVVQGFNVPTPEDCEWRIFSIPGFDVTPGTGQAPPIRPHLALAHE